MGDLKPTVVITGVSGTLGLRLLPLLSDYEIIGVDLKSPETDVPVQFLSTDLGDEASCRELTYFMREVRPAVVVHLAFVADRIRAEVDPDRMWHINVAGTARVMEAVTETNRDESIVQKFIYPSSVEVYGANLGQPAAENLSLSQQSSLYGAHKLEADKVVQQRAPSLRGCSVFMLRPNIFAGAEVENYVLDAFRGVPKKQKANALDRRIPLLLPYGNRYLENRLQFVHVEDVARLIAYILARTEPESQRLTILNVAGRGEPLTFERAISLAHTKARRVPIQSIYRLMQSYMWKTGLSAVPSEAIPYLTSEYLMNTDRLQKFLGAEYENVIQHTVEEAFIDSFSAAPVQNAEHSTVNQ